MRPGAILAWLLALAPSAPAQPAAFIKAIASKTEVTIGEAFRVEIQATGPAGTVWTFPQDASSESVEMKAMPSEGVRRYQAMVFALRDVSVPPVTARYRLSDGSEGEARTEPIPVRVTSLLPREREEQKLADIRPPLALSVGLAFWIALAALALVLVAALTFFIRRRRRASPALEQVMPETPPDAEARALLDRLETSGLLERGELRAFYIELTAIAKGYLERRLSEPIVEMTSTETLSALRDQVHAPLVVAPMRSLLGSADPVKFARGSGDTADARSHLLGVREMIASLEARLQPPPEEREKVA
jgi:hypothetical protein